VRFPSVIGLTRAEINEKGTIVLTVGTQVLLGDLEVLVGRLVDSRNVEDISFAEQLETLEWCVGFRGLDSRCRLGQALANLAFSIPLRVANLLNVVRARLTELRRFLDMIPVQDPPGSIADWTDLALEGL